MVSAEWREQRADPQARGGGRGAAPAAAARRQAGGGQGCPHQGMGHE